MSQLLNNVRSGLTRANISLFSGREIAPTLIIPHRTKYYSNRHRDPKYRTERARKLWQIQLPDFDQMRRDEKTLEPDEVRTKLKEKGVAPPNRWEEKGFYDSCTNTVIDPYKIEEGEGKFSSILSKTTTPIASSKNYVKNTRALSVIKSYEGDEFRLKDFELEATGFYVAAYEALASRDEDKLFERVTEHCFPIMTAGIARHTIIWKYLGDIEPCQAVQVRAMDILEKNNKYAQITVRFHTKQILAIYDRHGRLVHGSPTDVKDVLEYVVFEKYLANEYGVWRVHERLRPDTVSGDALERVSKTVVL